MTKVPLHTNVIDISPAIKSERKNVTKEILVACRYYGIEVSDIQTQKLKLFEEQIRRGNPRKRERVGDARGAVPIGCRKGFRRAGGSYRSSSGPKRDL